MDENLSQALDKCLALPCDTTIDHDKWRGWRGIKEMSCNIAELIAQEENRPINVKQGSIVVYTAMP